MSSIIGNELFLNEFEHFLKKVKKNRDKTVKKTLYLANVLLGEIDDISKQAFEDFRDKKEQEGKRANYINKFVTCVRLWGQCFNINDLLDTPYDRRKTAKFKTLLSAEDAIRVITCPVIYEQHREAHNMYSLFFAILATTGMRVEELADMELDRINWGMNAFIMREIDTKTSMPRIVPINDNIRDGLKQRFNKAAREGNKLLFYNQAGKKLVQQKWNYNFRTRLKHLGIFKAEGLSVRRFRDKFITDMLRQTGVTLYDVQALVGHSSAETTQIYYKYDTERLQEISNKHPLIRSSLSKEKRLEWLRNHILAGIKECSDLPEAEEARQTLKGLGWW